MIFGMETAFWFHVVNVGLHVISSALFTKICSDVIGFKRKYCLLAGIFFVIHPIHTESKSLFVSTNFCLEMNGKIAHTQDIFLDFKFEHSSCVFEIFLFISLPYGWDTLPYAMCTLFKGKFSIFSSFFSLSSFTCQQKKRCFRYCGTSWNFSMYFLFTVVSLISQVCKKYKYKNISIYFYVFLKKKSCLSFLFCVKSLTEICVYYYSQISTVSL